MDKSNGGGIRLPIGYRFHPTDEELIVHYLRRKIFGFPLPASVITELDVFQNDPWALPGDLKEKRYFFGRKRGNEGGKRCKIAAGSGYWKPIGKPRPILSSINHIVGVRKSFVFCHSEASTVQWVMQEYHHLHKIQASKPEMGEWVVYRFFQRRRRAKRQGKISSKSLNCRAMIHSNIQCSSPCSSGITEVHSTGLDQEEITSFYP